MRGWFEVVGIGRRLACLLCATSAPIGCGGDEAAAPVGLCGGEPCDADCLALAGANCDVLQPECQQRVLDALICVRGTPATRPEIRTLTEAEYRRQFGGGADDAGVSDAGVGDPAWPLDAGETRDAALADGGTPEELEEPGLDHWSAALGLLGLLAPDTDTWQAREDRAIAYTAGYYSSVEQRVTLIDRGEPVESPTAQRLLAHELVHALQDQAVGLPEFARRGPSGLDGVLSRGCLVEGEADLYEELAWSLLQGASLDLEAWDVELSWRLKWQRGRVLRSDSPYASVGGMQYALGVRYLFDAWLDGGNWAVQSLFDAPPTSTIHWLVGYQEYQERRQPLLQPLSCDRAAVPDGYVLYDDDSLGPLVLYAFLGHTLRDEGRFELELHWQRVQHWRQDRFSVMAGPEDETALSYRVRFDEAVLAQEVAAELREVDRGPDAARWFVRRHGQEIELLTGTDADALEGVATDPDDCPEW